MKKQQGGCTKFLMFMFFIYTGFFFLMAIVDEDILRAFRCVAIVSVAALLFSLLKTGIPSLKNRSNPSEKGSIESYANLSQKELVKVLFTEEAERVTGSEVKLVAKKAIIFRAVFGVCLAAAIAVVLCTVRELELCIYGIITAAAVFGLLASRLDTKFFINRAAKKAPETPAMEIVEKHTVNAKESRASLICSILCGALAVVAAVAAIVPNLKTQIKTVDVDGGCSVLQYRHGWLDSNCDIVIPETVDGKTVVSISEKAFAYNARIKSVELPETAVTIEKSAFLNCSSLAQIKLSPETVKIDSAAFSGCRSLESIELPDSLAELNAEVFKNCASLKSIEIPQGVTEIRGYAFYGCKSLGEVSLHDGIKDIHAYAFYGCSSIETIDLPPEITEIHAYTFEGCKALRGVDIPVGVTRIAAHAFYGCTSLMNVTVPDTVKEIGSSAFRECSNLLIIQLPENVAVNEKAFKDSPTTIEKKIFDDETMKKIEEELEALEITEVYVVCLESTGEPYIDEEKKSMLAGSSERLTEIIAEGLTVKVISTPAEFLEYLKKYRSENVTKVTFGHYSEVASEAAGEVMLMGNEHYIDDLIETYEKDATEF